MMHYCQLSSWSHFCYRLRQGNETEVEFLVDILPGLIVDFLPRMDSMNMVVSEVISQQQSRPWLAALVMSKVNIIYSCTDSIMVIMFRLFSCC